MKSETKYEARRRFILDWLRNPILNGAHQISVDVVDQAFVEAFSVDLKVPVKVMPYGADLCPILGQTLSKMAKEGSLVRSISSIHGMGGMGFPKWVYCYELPDYAVKALQKEVADCKASASR